MRTQSGRAALWLSGALLVVLALLGLWLVWRDAEDGAASSMRSPTAGDEQDAAQPLPTFSVEPLATEAAPTAETATAADAASAPAGALGDIVTPLRALVVHSDGTPAAGATVVAAAAGDLVLDTQRTDADGAAQFSITDGRVELYVGGATPKPERFEIEPARGEHRLVLPDGAFVGGIVLLDGLPPEEPIGLVLESSDPPVFDAPFRLQLALATVDTQMDRVKIGQHTTEGQFLFSGLPADWSGFIAFPAWYRLEGEGAYGRFRVERPATGLTIRLTYDGALTGRLLEPAAAEAPLPAAFAEVAFELHLGDGSSRSGAVGTDELGRFRLPLHTDHSASGVLRFRSADRGARESREFEDVDPRTGRDFGDILLERTQRAEFLVLDQADSPIQGAVATALDETEARSRPTNAAGEGVLPDLLPETTAIRVDALGYEPVELPLSDDMVARLLPAPLLQLELVDATGAPHGALVVRLDCSHRLFDCEGEDCSGIDELQAELGATSFFESSVTTGPRYERFEGKAFARGQALFTRIHAGVPFTVEVQDHYGTQLRAPEELRLAPREQRQLQWRIDAQPRTVSVKALTTAGVPIPGAEVALHEARPDLAKLHWQGFSTRRTAGEDGVVRFEQVFATAVSLQVQRKGYGTAWLVDRAVPADGAEFELRLEKGRTIDVEVVDASGSPRDVSRVALDGTPGSVAAQKVALGQYRLEDAPPGPVTLRADLRGRSYRVQLEPGSSGARIEIPELGGVSAGWTVSLAPDRLYTILVRGLGDDAWSTYGSIGDDARQSSGPLTIADLQPGDYEVVLREGFGWTGENPPVSQVARVTVKAGEVTEVLLEP